MATHRDTKHRFTVTPRPPRSWRAPPPPPPKQRWLDTIPSNVVFYGIMLINGLVFGTWYIANSNARYGDYALRSWMHDNFLISYRNLSNGRIWTLVTSCFSHEGLGHIAFNGFTYFFFARPVIHALGNARFLTLYLGGGTVGGLLSTFYHTKIKSDKNYQSHGASAAIYSLLSFVACIAPRATVLLYGVIPLQIWVVVSGIFVYDVYRTTDNMQGNTDTVGHIGGLLAGMGYYIARRFGVVL